jgi:uncharacterized GH25 family protein
MWPGHSAIFRSFDLRSTKKHAAAGLLLLTATALASAAAAHDFWIQPQNFWLAAKTPTSTLIEVGHGPDRQISPISADRITLFRDIGPGGAQVDLRPTLVKGEGTKEIKLSFAAPGTHLVELETNHTESNLPSIRFNDYVKVEGIQPIIQFRPANHKTDAPGREIYSRRAKALMQVGPIDAKSAALATRPLGLSLEIVPDKNPYQLGPNEGLPVHVIYEGHPLQGALVKLTNLEFDMRPVEMHVTDQAGRASFSVPRNGSWLLNVIWSKPITGNPKADFDTTFSSFSFAFPPGGLH